MLPILPIWTLNWKPYSSTMYVKLFITIIYTIYHTYVYKKSKISFSYMLYAYSVKEPIGELNLKRALDEDTGVFSSFFPFFRLLLHWVRQPFLGIPPFISDPGSLCLFLHLDLL